MLKISKNEEGSSTSIRSDGPKVTLNDTSDDNDGYDSSDDALMEMLGMGRGIYNKIPMHAIISLDIEESICESVEVRKNEERGGERSKMGRRMSGGWIEATVVHHRLSLLKQRTYTSSRIPPTTITNHPSYTRFARALLLLAGHAPRHTQ